MNYILSQVVVYRSLQEKNMDEALNDVIYPWIYNHWWLILIAIIAAIFWVSLAEKNKYRR